MKVQLSKHRPRAAHLFTALAPVRGVPCTPLQIASELGHADCVALLGGGTGMAL